MLRKMIHDALNRDSYFKNKTETMEEKKIETEKEFDERMEVIANEKFREAIKGN